MLSPEVGESDGSPKGQLLSVTLSASAPIPHVHAQAHVHRHTHGKKGCSRTHTNTQSLMIDGKHRQQYRESRACIDKWTHAQTEVAASMI